LRRLFVERCEVRRFLTTRSLSLDKKERKMRDRSIVEEVFFVKIVFLEKRNDRTRFELIRKGTSGERKVYDVSQGR